MENIKRRLVFPVKSFKRLDNPCVGVFRALVKQNKKTGECSWALDPFKVWEEKKESIVMIILDNSRNAAGDSPDQIGKSSLILDALYNSIFIYRLMKKA